MKYCLSIQDHDNITILNVCIDNEYLSKNFVGLSIFLTYQCIVDIPDWAYGYLV